MSTDGDINNPWLNHQAENPPAAKIVCDQHHWISIHQPGLPIYWIEQCSLCHDFNAERMIEELKIAGWIPALPLKPQRWYQLRRYRTHT